MARQLGFPTGTGPDDFRCFGPGAVKDGEFDGVMIVDMGCFTQDGKDTNKMYHAAVVQHKQTGDWYLYTEWGRTGAKTPQFQFTKCRSKEHAQEELSDQCHSKNDKRGQWVTIGGIKTLQAKPDKDCYLVRAQAKRSTGLPDARTITSMEPTTAKPKTLTTSAKKSVDDKTMLLMRDLNLGTISYTRSSMANAALPTQNAIDETRILLGEAKKRLIHLSDDVDEQVQDSDLKRLTAQVYSRIPKVKPLRAPAATWILSKSNVNTWEQDLDAFQSALSIQAGIDEQQGAVADPFYGMPLHMEYVDPKSDIGKFMYFWWPKASANRHHHLKEMKIHNVWKVDRLGDDAKFRKSQGEILADMGNSKPKECPLFQPPERYDVAPQERELYSRTNTALLHHGTKSVNVSGILRENFRQPKELVNVLITGAMFSGGGAGVYLADDIRKSAGYTSLHGSIWSSGSGGVAGRHAFMFACDAVLGQPHVADGPHPFLAPPNGHHCIFGMGKNHGKSKNSGVENNEWIVFKIQQICIRYLVEFSA